MLELCQELSLQLLPAHLLLPLLKLPACLLRRQYQLLALALVLQPDVSTSRLFAAWCQRLAGLLCWLCCCCCCCCWRLGVPGRGASEAVAQLEALIKLGI